MGRYTGLTGTVIFVRGNDQEFDVVGRYRILRKATLIVSASSVAYENTLGVLSEYVEAEKANIHIYGDGEIEMLLIHQSV
jgi:hypothetical protein